MSNKNLMKLVSDAAAAGKKEREANLKKIAEENRAREAKEEFEADSVIAKIPELVRKAEVDGKNYAEIYKIQYNDHSDTIKQIDASWIGPFKVETTYAGQKQISLRGVARKVYEQVVDSLQVYFTNDYNDSDSWYAICIRW